MIKRKYHFQICNLQIKTPHKFNPFKNEEKRKDKSKKKRNWGILSTILLMIPSALLLKDRFLENNEIQTYDNQIYLDPLFQSQITNQIVIPKLDFSLYFLGSSLVLLPLISLSTTLLFIYGGKI